MSTGGEADEAAAAAVDAHSDGSARLTAIAVLDVCVGAASAYRRSDLSERLEATRQRLVDPLFHTLVVGEFKQGKSSLINALLGVHACPVDDDVATAVPTMLRWSDDPGATVHLNPSEDGGDAQPDPIERVPVESVADYVSEAGNPDNTRNVQSVEIGLPSELLRTGLVLVDTPGVGGLGSSHSAITIGVLPMADAVLFVSDASQEFSGPEIEFLRTARSLCPNVGCVVTKIDFYPAWRKIISLDETHLTDAGLSLPVIAVSSVLRILAGEQGDPELDVESGFGELNRYLETEIVAKREELVVRTAMSDMLSVVTQLESQFSTEQQALADPDRAQALVDQLRNATEQSDRLRSQAARWQVTLNDGFADLANDVDHDLRSRLRALTREADEAIDNSDPAESWEEFEPWLYRAAADNIVGNYTLLQMRAAEVAARVSELFSADGQEVAQLLDIPNPSELLQSVGASADVELEKGSGLGTGMNALRSSYGGVLMFGVLGQMVGLALINPIGVVAGLLFGSKAYRDEKNRALAQRRSQAKNAHRKYTDELAFEVGKDTLDTVRRIQRQLRDHFTARAEELYRSTTDALQKAQQAIRIDESTREQRLQDVTAELTRIRGLRGEVLALGADHRQRLMAARMLLDEVRELLHAASEVYAGTPQEAMLATELARLDEPLRVAIAGKVKAGKSTLLNALVGEELAPTDAGECTKIVTWYRDGITYRVTMYSHDGEARQVPFSREAGALDVDLQGVAADSVDRLEIEWPSSSLRAITLIDTPGIASLSTDVSARTTAFLAPGDDLVTPADAVLYLMRHLHSTDIGFLEAFHDQEFAQATPVNAIAVLSRADEIGVGRLDSMASASRIAGRYKHDAKVRRLCQTVVPVAGLLAQSGSTLREAEFKALKEIAEAPADQADRLFLSADRFMTASTPIPLTTMEREHLLDRFGLFGVRLATALIRQGAATTSSQLSNELVMRSGLIELRQVLLSQFAARRDVLKSRSALLAVEAIVRDNPVDGSATVASELERITAGAHEFAEVRLLNALRAGAVKVKWPEAEEMERLLGADGTTPTVRLGLAAGATSSDIRTALQNAIARWQRRAENPLSSRDVADAARVLIRTCEGMLVDAG